MTRGDARTASPRARCSGGPPSRARSRRRRRSRPTSSIVVTGIVARARVRQEFTNPGADVGGRSLRLPAARGRGGRSPAHEGRRPGDRRRHPGASRGEGQYEQAKHEGRRASLVEQERPNVFTTSVANIAPGAAIAHRDRVPADASGTTRASSAYASRWWSARATSRERRPPERPAARAGRSIPIEVPDASRITPPVSIRRGPLNPVSLAVELDPGAPAGAAQALVPRGSRDAAGRRALPDRARAGGPVPADRDFELVWQPTPRRRPIATLFTERRARRRSPSSW